MPIKSMSRRRLLQSVVAVGCTGAFYRYSKSSNADAPAFDEEIVLKAKKLLTNTVSVDLHSHPGVFFLDAEFPSALEKTMGRTAFPYKTIEDMRVGKLSAFHMASVADRALLGVDFSKGKVYATRVFEEGEAWASFKRQDAQMMKVIDQAELAVGLSASNLANNKKTGKITAIKSVEGASFIEQDLGRLQTAYDMGYRSLQIVHYHVNQIGDIQTEEPVYNGLSDFGKELVVEMDRLGLLIDLAHASEAVVEDCLSRVSSPVIVSHTSICSPDRCHPRYQTPSQAKMVSAAGGVIGISPAGFISKTFDEFIGEIDAAVSLIGIDHVSALGTDMDANYKPVFTSYRDLHRIPAALLQKGYSETEVAKVIGENYVRVWGNNDI